MVYSQMVLLKNLKDAPIDSIIVTDTLTQNGNSKEIGKVEVLSVSTIIANALTSIFTDDSVSALFMGKRFIGEDMAEKFKQKFIW